MQSHHPFVSVSPESTTSSQQVLTSTTHTHTREIKQHDTPHARQIRVGRKHKAKTRLRPSRAHTHSDRERVESSLDFHNDFHLTLVVVHQMAHNLNLGQDTRAVHQMGFRRCCCPMDFDLSVSSNGYLSQQPTSTTVFLHFGASLLDFRVQLQVQAPSSKEQGRKCRAPCARGRAQGLGTLRTEKSCHFRLVQRAARESSIDRARPRN